MLYQSEAHELSEWESLKEIFLQQGFEYKIVNQVVYLRKNIDGELNIIDKGWIKE